MVTALHDPRPTWSVSFSEPPWDPASPEWLALDRDLAPDHAVRQIARLTDEELDLQALRRTYSGRGRRPHRPDLVLKLVLDEHSQGRPQPVQWFKDLQENTAVARWVYGMRPSQTVLYEFRDRAQPLIQQWNQQVIRTAIDEGHTDGTRGALDGTTVAAHASRHRLLSLETVERRRERLEQEIAQAEAAPDATAAPPPRSPGGPLAAGPASSPPPGSSGPEPPSFLGKTLRGQKRQRARYRRAREILRDRHRANRRRRKDKRKEGARIRLAIGDPAAPFGLDKLQTYRPLYNVQTMSDVGTDLVLA